MEIRIAQQSEVLTLSVGFITVSIDKSKIMDNVDTIKHFSRMLNLDLDEDKVNTVLNLYNEYNGAFTGFDGSVTIIIDKSDNTIKYRDFKMEDGEISITALLKVNDMMQSIHDSINS